LSVAPGTDVAAIVDASPDPRLGTSSASLVSSRWNRYSRMVAVQRKGSRAQLEPRDQMIVCRPQTPPTKRSFSAPALLADGGL